MLKKVKNLSTEPYKGTRDFYPEDMFLQKYIFEKMRKIVEKYGYIEYNASILEETALYKAKSGEEILNEQTYSFTDRGGREITMRPEMTPTIARMVARKRKELPFPLRWYSIPNLFRYERPQRGRLREHWQLNVDIFGVETIEADAEIISLSYDIMKEFGAGNADFQIRINNRKIINHLLNKYFKLSNESAYKISKLIDRKDKINEKEFISQAKIILEDRADLLIDFLNIKSINDVPKEIAGEEGINEIKFLFSNLESRGINNFIFSPSLMRGFDYYTGIIFEIFDTNPANSRSLFGGGRYDDLVGLFGVEKVSGVGFGMGDVTIKDYLETYKRIPEYKSTTEVYLCPLKQDYIKFANELAVYLRENGINTAVDITNRKIASQIKTADKQAIPFIICIGEDEIKTKKLKLKNLKESKEYLIKYEDLPNLIKK